MQGLWDDGAIMLGRLTQLTITVLLALPILTACQAAPRGRPVKMGPVDTGAGSLESVRRQLQGSWELVTLEVMAPGGGAPTKVPATGHLKYDEYGNLTIDGRVTAAAGGVDPNVLNMSGRAVIDPDKHMLRFQDVEATTAAARSPARLAHRCLKGQVLRVRRRSAEDDDERRVRRDDSHRHLEACELISR